MYRTAGMVNGCFVDILGKQIAGETQSGVFLQLLTFNLALGLD